MAAVSTQPQIAPGVITAGPGSDFQYLSTSWRTGPLTPDGFWIVTTSPRGDYYWAIRVIIDPEARPLKMSGGVLHAAIEAALFAPRYRSQDDYLASLSVVAALPPSELQKLRLAVLEGRTGGSADGAAKRPGRSRANVSAG